MDITYIFFCGMVWTQFGEEAAGLELIRALASPDQDVRVVARTMLEQANDGSRELIGEMLAQDQISVSEASLCGFEQCQKSKFKRFHGGVWFPPASA